MIEVGKRYYISLSNDSELAGSLERSHVGDKIDIHRLLGTVEHVHGFGFLFRLDKEEFPKVATLNVRWETLRFIYTEEDGKNGT